MRNVLVRLRVWLHDRRKKTVSVPTERRGAATRMREAEEKLDAAIAELDKTVRMRKEDLFRRGLL